MRYVLALFIPPIAVVSTGKLGHAILNFVLCVVLSGTTKDSEHAGLVLGLSVGILGHAWWCVQQYERYRHERPREIIVIERRREED